MALFCKDVAIASVGVSCQAAMQMEENTEFIGRLLNGEPVTHVTPFDWLICDPEAGAALLIEDKYFPDSVEELDFSHVLGVWTRMGVCCYWHEAKLASRPQREFVNTESKFRHTSETFRGMSRYARRIFILANTQNNLPVVTERLSKFDFVLDDRRIEILQAALTKRFGEIEMWTVTYPNRHQVQRNNARLIELEPDSSNVRGDSEQWRQRVFQRILG